MSGEGPILIVLFFRISAISRSFPKVPMKPLKIRIVIFKQRFIIWENERSCFVSWNLIEKSFFEMDFKIWETERTLFPLKKIK